MHKTWKKQTRAKKKKYLVEELDEDVYCEGILSRILLYLKPAHLVVVNANELLEIFKLYFSKCPNAKQFGMEVVLNMIVLHGTQKQSNENQWTN